MSPNSDVIAPFLLMRAFRGLVDAVHESLADAGFPGIRAQHEFALQAIGAGCTSVQLGERLGVTKQAATKTAHSLEAMGLITRETNTSDRRERTLTITTAGRRLLALSADAFCDELARWRRVAGDDAVTTTLTTLSQFGVGGRSDVDLSDWI
ncbi:MarR family winged helix-turn-helix transcriptional regulator [Williamsia sterculiae]|uniref:MarR family protein n=1 Tax=Williamsia sterculiae TaxID=1344003 RepID=A0A1N7G4Y7_9NOCA|nr:MarR family winged helix-turn-helix transcriptional regulator [Williamsia sterculiae]SIS07673.1 MarR family protein [Williamsia sterculiae]